MSEFSANTDNSFASHGTYDFSDFKNWLISRNQVKDKFQTAHITVAGLTATRTKFQT